MTPDREFGTGRNSTSRGVFQQLSEPWLVYASLVLFALVLWSESSLTPAPRVVRQAEDAATGGASLGPAHLVTRNGRSVVLLAREQCGAFVDVRTDCDLDPAVYAALADRVLPRLRGWFGPGRASTAQLPHYTLFLCSSAGRMLEVERLCGEPSSNVAGRTFAFRGGFYDRSAMALIPPGSEAWTRWLVVHELAHAAFHERVGGRADVIDEGLAEVLPDWLLFSDAARPEDHTSTYTMHEWNCAEAAIRPSPPTLIWLCKLDYWGFRDDRIENLGFAASWALMKVLVESRDPAIGGRVHALLSDLANGFPLQAALDREVGLAPLDLVWRARMRSWLDWEPWWGTWHDDGRDWSATLKTWDANLLLAHDQPGKRAFELGFTWQSPTSEFVGLGFALGMRDEETYDVLLLVESEKRVLLQRFRGGTLEREFSWPLPEGLEFDCKSIVLSCRPTGRSVLAIGDFAFPLEELDATALEGSCGLIAQRLLYAPRRVETRFSFLAPWNRIPTGKRETGAAQAQR